MSISAPPPYVQRDFPLARLATVRTGGPAELFARAGSEAQLLELLAWAQAAQAPVAVVGSGSNLLVADEGVPGLVLKLGGSWRGSSRRGRGALSAAGEPACRRWPRTPLVPASRASSSASTSPAPWAARCG